MEYTTDATDCREYAECIWTPSHHALSGARVGVSSNSFLKSRTYSTPCLDD
ncbi:hypothetical protein BgiMline_009692, partial [Biomphalaria glabrata]